MFNEIVYAQTSTPESSQAPPMGGGGSLFIYIALMFFIFYLFLIRPQQKKSKEHENFLKNLKVGDYVVTSGGIHGKIIKIGDIVVTLEVGEKMRIKVSKAYISGFSALKKDKEKEEE